jgi:putative SOS response-associated peptidase YedK
MVWTDYHLFLRKFHVTMSITDFYEQFYKRRRQGELFPKRMDLAFANPQNDDERRIKALIDELNAAEVMKQEKQLFKQRARLVENQRKLETKFTKSAEKEVGIASRAVDQAMRKISDARRTEAKERDSRIFPNWYAPVLFFEDGELKLLPMRYHCRPAGMPASSDWVIDKVTKKKTISGKYNARRDNLEKFWRKQFGYTHGIAVMSSFYENVPRHKNEGRALAPGEKEENMILHFNPQPAHDMFVACLWSYWKEGDKDLYSFAAITDEPPPEIAAAGHDRCIIPIKEHNIDAWLRPNPKDLDAMHAILDDRDRPFYEYQLAA